MENNNIIERFGGLIKEEPLTYLQDDILLENTSVLESVAPFYGYYNNFEPLDHKPLYLYCPLNGYFSFETIARATQQVRKVYKEPFDAVTGTITLRGVANQVIRMRNLADYDHISMLQQLYHNQGIAFRKRFGKVENEMAMIKLRKFMFLEAAGDDIFIDKAQAHHAYFVIPEQMDWESFKKLTDRVKYDPNYYFFDGAIAFMYDKGEIRDMVRIYRENFTVEEIRELKKKYLKLLA